MRSGLPIGLIKNQTPVLNLTLSEMKSSNKTKKRDIVSLLLYITGACFFLGAAYNWYSVSPAEPVVPELYEVVSDPISIQALYESSEFQFEDTFSSFEKDEVVFLYLMTPNPCGICINEVTDFVAYTEDHGFANKSVRNIGLVSDPDVKKAERFLKTYQFSLPVGFGYDEKWSPILEQFNDRSVARQLLMIDPETNQIFFRHLLKTGEMTPEEHKNALLKEASKAYKRLR